MKEDIVQWRQWHPDSFEAARREEKAVFLFITHPGCAWCAQMETESFSDEEIAALLQRDFVAIRVDSYERPDINRYYHRLFTQMTGREANNPLCIFLSHDKIPLYAATYMPDRDREGRMGLCETLELVGKKYHAQRALLLSKGREILEAIETEKSTIEATRLDVSVADLISEQIKASYDKEHGGFGGKPKFPRYAVLALLMDSLERKKDTVLEQILAHTLDAMISKGLRDPEDGGFYLYCSDTAWEDPVEGKTLYDNAWMAQILLRASALLEEKYYRDIALQTIAFLQTKWINEGLFGTFYEEKSLKESRVIVSWNAMAVKSLLLAGEADSVCRQMGIEILSRVLEYGMQSGVLYHSFRPGETPEVKAFLEDYAFLSDTLLLAYESTGEEHYLIKASELINTALKTLFHGGVWRYSTGETVVIDHPEDREYPSALAVMAEVLQKAAKLIDPAYEKFADRTLEVHSYTLMREPLSVPQLSRVLLASV